MTQYNRVAIVGVGLLGGSIGYSLRARGLAKSVVGYGRDVSKLAKACELGALTDYTPDLTAACVGSDVLVVCTPVQLVADYVAEALQHLPNEAIVTDVGSTKGLICSALDEAMHARFCGSHPLAGSDRSGVEHAEPDLFNGKLTIVTPHANTELVVVERVEAFWQALGSRTQRMSPQDHDEAVARTSHLPHLLASMLAAHTPPELLPLTASGWADTTRVAAGNVEMWRQIIADNRPALLAALSEFRISLETWHQALESGDDALLVELLTQGKRHREQREQT